MNSKIIKCLCYIISLGMFAMVVGVELQVPLIFQEDKNTCWAATCRMILTAYNTSFNKTEQQILDYGTSGDKIQNATYGTAKSCDKVLFNFGAINTVPRSDGFYYSDIKKEIDKHLPIFARRLYNGGLDGHSVVIIGYSGTNKIIINDPNRTVGRKEWDYDLFTAENIVNRWTHSLRMATEPRTEIPIGFYDYALIQSGGTEVIGQGTSTLQYHAHFSSNSTPRSTPSTWTWNLVFPHSGGDYVITWTSQSTLYESTWNITGFSLPSGYQWKYNFDGKIPGRVEVVVDDNAGPLHNDAINAVYVPTNLYPGNLLYENHTITNAQPDVKAHEEVIVQNDQFLIGANISFKSGEKININDGVTIQNGAVTNFSIDPTIR